MLIHDYKPEWADAFSLLRDALANALAPIEIKIEHVGSTAVFGLAAKPIIDIDIVYEAEADFKTIKSQLDNLGYYHNGDQGIAGREVFKRRFSLVSKPLFDEIKHHLYVCHKDNVELNNHLAFRDYLRENKSARNQYQALKYQIAAEADQNQKVYAQLKETKARTFITIALQTKISN